MNHLSELIYLLYEGHFKTRTVSILIDENESEQEILLSTKSSHLIQLLMLESFLNEALTYVKDLLKFQTNF